MTADIASGSIDFDIPGIKVVRKLGEGASSQVYEVLYQEKKYALKVFKEVQVSEADRLLNEYRREATTLNRVQHKGIPKVMMVGDVGRRPFMIMELAEGQELTKVFDPGPLDEKRMVKIAIGIVEAIGALHKIGLIHRDIKPANIVCGPNDAIKILDLQFASGAKQSTDNQPVAATLLYASPEQLGLIQCPVDRRSDLYAIGVVLFKGLTGALPCASEDLNELVQFHSLGVVPDVRDLRPNISESVATVVNQLIAKDPYDRYQSTAALLADLRDVESALEGNNAANSTIKPKSQSPFVDQETELVGREQEFKRIVDLFKTSNFGVGLIRGISGSGKSRLVREICRAVGKPDVSIAFSKCVEANQFPYLPIRILFDELLEIWENKVESEGGNFVEKLRNLASGSEDFLAKFSPSVAARLGLSKSNVNSDTSADRFNEVLSSIFKELLSSIGRTFLIIDDVQWLDQASNSLLAFLAREFSKTEHFLLLTSRSDDVYAPAHERLQESLGERIVAQVDLAPFGAKEVRAYVSSLLSGKDQEDSLIDFLFSRTNGNPFSIQEYLRLIIDHGALYPDWDHWIFDQERLKTIDIPTNLKDIVLKRLEQVPQNELDFLCRAALIGSRFKSETLQHVCQASKETIMHVLNSALQNGLLEVDQHGEFVFVHDSIQEALVSMLEQDQKVEAHHEIVQALLSSKEDGPESVLSLADHYFNGRPETNPQEAIDANTRAGRITYDGYASSESLRFLDQAKALSERFNTSLGVDFYLLVALVYARLDQFQEAIASQKKALELTNDHVRRAGIYADLARFYHMNVEAGDAWECVTKGFAEVSYNINAPILVQVLGAVKDLIFGLFIQFTGLFSGKLSQESLDLYKAQSLLAAIGAETAWFQLRLISMTKVMLRSFFVAQRIGPSPNLVYGLGYIAILYTELQMVKVARFYSRVALKTADDLGDPGEKAFAGTFRTFCLDQTGDHLGSERVGRKLLLENGKFLKANDYLNCSASIAFNLVIRGRFKEADSVVGLIADKCQRSTSELFKDHVYLGIVGSVKSIVGLNAEGRSFLDRIENSRHLEPDKLYYWTLFLLWRQMACYNVGYYDACTKKMLDRWHQLKISPFDVSYHQRTVFLMLAYAEMENCLADFAKGVEPDLKVFRRRLFDLRLMMLVGSLRSHRIVLYAALEIFIGNFGKGEKLLAAAESEANRIDAPWVLLEVSRLRGHVAAKSGQKLSAVSHFQAAVSLAVRTGSAHRSKRLIQEAEVYGISVQAEESNVSTGKTVHYRDIEESKLRKHLDTLVEISRGSTELFNADRQIREILSRVAKIFGAERAAIFLVNKENGKIEFRDGCSAEGQPISELKGYSTTIIGNVAEIRAPIHTSGNDQGEVSLSASSMAYGLRSIMAAPILQKDETLGVIYLDNSLTRGVFQSDDVDVLAAIASQIAVAFETAKSAKLEIERKTMEKDLEVSASVQKMFLPEKAEQKIGRIRIAGYYRPAAQCGGDWWWYSPIGEDKTAIVVGDVTGHGAGPAMITASIASCFQVMKDNMTSAVDVDQLIHAAQRQLFQLSRSEYGMTMMGIEFSQADGKLQCLSAGSPGFLLSRADGKTEYILPHGSILGSADFKIGKQEVDLQIGDRLFIFTDGISEQKLPSGQMLGLRRLVKLIEKLRTEDLDIARDNFVVEMDKLRAGEIQDDDVTYVFVEVVS